MTHGGFARRVSYFISPLTVVLFQVQIISENNQRKKNVLKARASVATSSGPNYPRDKTQNSRRAYLSECILRSSFAARACQIHSKLHHQMRKCV